MHNIIFINKSAFLYTLYYIYTIAVAFTGVFDEKGMGYTVYKVTESLEGHLPLVPPSQQCIHSKQILHYRLKEYNQILMFPQLKKFNIA